MTETYSPWEHVRALPDVVVAYAALEHADAYWEPDQRVILLDARLSQRARRSCLAHELAHVARGDVGCEIGPDGERQERRQEVAADALASRRLITLDALAEALLWCLGYDEVAEHLHVDERMVRARLRGLTEAEKDYIAARMAGREESA